jgi:beta-galactosidase
MRQFSLSFFLILLFIQNFAQAQSSTSTARKSISLNQAWWFAKDPSAAGLLPKNLKWEKVNVPHTWNAFDVMDDVPGYYRGIGWYKKKLALLPAWKGKQLFLYFEGANQETAVYLNGKKIGGHIGGYTGFRVPLTQLKFDGTDEISIKVDNSFNESIAPLTGDFTFFGGLYRNVSLEVLNAVHFEDGAYASKGVFVKGSNVTRASAEISVKGQLINTGKTNANVALISVLTDADGKKVAEVKTNLAASANRLIAFQLPVIAVSNPKLWSPENPYLYLATTRLVDRAGKIIDEVKVNVGLRFFHFDAEKGFFLNGSPYKLIGSSRHQDFEGLGNAVPSALAIKDVELIKQMGGNFLRVAHYPQDQVVLDACDRLGLLASVEIPIVNEITETAAFTNNCKNMQLEMIWQNYNHPSVIIWAYMNEVLLKMRHQNDPARKLKYIANIEKLAQTLEDLTRTTDPSRYTMMSNHGDVNGYSKAGLIKIPQLVGWNLYQGWYGGKIEDFGPNLDKIHQQMLDKPMLVTEFGADADPRIHAFSPVKFDKSLEYAMRYHQGYLKDILSRPFVAGAAVWNLADFSSETRDETMPHVNNKGLLTLGRQPKNTFYLYQANFNPQPFVKIGDGSWPLRGGVASTDDRFLNQNVQVISNADSVELFLNGKSLGKNGIIDKVGNWQAPFVNGKNELRAIAHHHGETIEDRSSVNFQIQPSQLNTANFPFKAIQISMGSERQYIDFQQKQLWLPNKPYTTGSWGSIGGEPFKIKNSSRQAYGSDKNIRGTLNDPIYQTQLVGLSGYQLDVPKGKYEVTLHFAELMGNGIQSVLPYNLDSLVAEGKEVPPQRVFDVYLNDKLVVKDINLAATYGVANSVQKKFECIITDEKGIRLRFKSSKGQAVLNALQVKRVN